ncbi:hypothetical protein GCM10011487_54110 [Steroidobacter agaridevorans]|uniref:KfrA N-terminal DNA-binding domain-containing protein n=1 Tax=Steroidobacter agaridevorans TaxID=2695856 RepID=A0A829YKN6_9GAMM|nr:DNA-binding protein [Steroidobacter agaridevorans]GFE83411.1 hypothetical protein GCM10011487_54110 [Steroidobacter agaridevorans]
MSAETTDLARRAPRISAEDVFAAADTLLGEGHKPTIDRVRMQLGRGSPNTINEHLDRWWRELGTRFRESAGLALPSVPESISSRLIELWNLALRESQQALQTQLAEREAAVLAREMAVAERETALDGRFEANLEALQLAQDQLVHANERARVLEATLQQTRSDLEQRDRQASALGEELAALRRQAEAVLAQHGAERTRLNERYDALQDRSALDIDRLQLAQKEDKKHLKEVRAQLERAVSERDRVGTELTRLETELATIRGQNERLLAASARAPAKSPARRPPPATPDRSTC